VGAVTVDTAAPRTALLSRMTLLEKQAYRAHGGVNVTWGYPEGITPAWIRNIQEHPPSGWLDVPPTEYEAMISEWFAGFFGGSPGVMLTQSCTQAFAIAAEALIEPGDEVVLVDSSFELWPARLWRIGAVVRYTPRSPSGEPSLGAIRAACGPATKAIVIVSPDNPGGTICPPAILTGLLGLCQERGLTLVADHSLAGLNPRRRQLTPLLPALAAGEAASWIAVSGTSKLIGTAGAEVGVLAYPPWWAQRLEAAASHWFARLPHYDLAVTAAVLADGRFRPYLLEISGRISANYARLREYLAPPLALGSLGAGCFALVDAAGLGTDDVTFAERLLDQHGVSVVPVSWFPRAEPVPESRVRVALSRPWQTIAQVAEALNACAASCQEGRMR
jgi:N-succinyldiaminopimelate aminotransferase